MSYTIAHQQLGLLIVYAITALAVAISGEKDSVVPPQLSRTGFQRIPAPAKTFVELTGFNHYSINDSQQPDEAPPEENTADFSN